MSTHSKEPNFPKLQEGSERKKKRVKTMEEKKYTS